MPKNAWKYIINIDIISDWTLQEELTLQMRNVLYVIFSNIFWIYVAPIYQYNPL